MKKTLAAFSLLFAVTANAELQLKDSKLYFNGVRQEFVFGRSCFKLANMVTYHWVGDGGGPYSLGAALDFVLWNQSLGIKACRVLLETAGWQRCEQGAQANDGKPDNCMFGSEPFDRGFWDVEALRNGPRPTELTGVGRETLRWFFQTSQETGFMFELVIDATLKHDGVSVEQQSQVIRQVMAAARELQEEFPQALILMNAINEWNAHSDWQLTGASGVNQLAVRNDRCKNEAGQTVVALGCPVGYDPEQWSGGPLIVDGGGGNRAEYEIGPEPGRFRGAFVHPKRDDTWNLWPDQTEREWMIADARGMPWGATESMFYVEPEDDARARQWYNAAGDGWTSDWPKYEGYLNHINLSWQPRVNAASGVETAGMAYFVGHDEKGVECLVNWPRRETRFETWAREHLGGEPPPPPPEKKLYFDAIIDSCYWFILGRDADPGGMATYNDWFRECMKTNTLPVCRDALQQALFSSEEYRAKFYH